MLPKLPAGSTRPIFLVDEELEEEALLFRELGVLGLLAISPNHLGTLGPGPVCGLSGGASMW